LLLEDDLKIELLLMLLICEVTKIAPFLWQTETDVCRGEEAEWEVAVILQD
jgi:hypothetical protein